MSTAATPPTTEHGHADAHAGNGHGHGHNPHLAHHFDTPEQQFASGKLGIWLFLATEILMFGGLFCAYSVYRHNHPDVFSFAHHALNKWLGGINTIVLIASSLTMAWGVRAAQLGKTKQLVWCLIATILGGYIFMGIKAVEYRDKWAHNLGAGRNNEFSVPIAGGALPKAETKAEGEKGGMMPATPASTDAKKGDHAAPAPSSVPGHSAKVEHAGHTARPAAATSQPIAAVADPNAGSPDASLIRPPAYVPGSGIVAKSRAAADAHHEVHVDRAADMYLKMGHLDQQRVYTFFQTYFVMTGLHGIHVLVGMALIFWILLRAVGRPHRGWVLPLGMLSLTAFLFYLLLILPRNAHTTAGLGVLATTGWVTLALFGVWFVVAYMRAKAARMAPQPEFGPEYFTPVDLVGLYWHIVDLIWIFLFPLLYLIH
ncbi:MAG TPA: cytochrome c oxidase subunit 3 [Tepidisphaeraceae bacterium]|nr:cytochrome c oxidase subunit 3 [Tepidisphaeraceae bacterium]